MWDTCYFEGFFLLIKIPSMGAKKGQVRSNPLILANLFPFQLQLWEVNVTVKCLRIGMANFDGGDTSWWQDERMLGWQSRSNSPHTL